MPAPEAPGIAGDREAQWREAALRDELREHLRWAEDGLQDAELNWRELVRLRGFEIEVSHIGGLSIAASRVVPPDADIPGAAPREPLDIDSQFPHVRPTMAAQAQTDAWRHERLAAIAVAASQALESKSTALMSDTCRAIVAERERLQKLKRRQDGKEANPPSEQRLADIARLRDAFETLVQQGNPNPRWPQVFPELQHRGAVRDASRENGMKLHKDDVIVYPQKTLQNWLSEIRREQRKSRISQKSSRT